MEDYKGMECVALKLCDQEEPEKGMEIYEYLEQKGYTIRPLQETWKEMILLGIQFRYKYDNLKTAVAEDIKEQQAKK